MQFLLHIHKKNVFLLSIPTEVPFCAKSLYPSLQDSIFQQFIWAKIIQVVWGPHYVCHCTKPQKNCLFTLSPHQAMVASFSSLSTLCKPAPTDVPAFTIWYYFIRSMSDPQSDLVPLWWTADVAEVFIWNNKFLECHPADISFPRIKAT